ncbi:hypothetical protein BDQ17DRAFT_373488 [Cyathus striatus]|nr:hypothetical protein BDQ17DRAFT_373488 [Cyathus striatus]
MNMIFYSSYPRRIPRRQLRLLSFVDMIPFKLYPLYHPPYRQPSDTDRHSTSRAPSTNQEIPRRSFSRFVPHCTTAHSPPASFRGAHVRIPQFASYCRIVNTCKHAQNSFLVTYVRVLADCAWRTAMLSFIHESLPCCIYSDFSELHLCILNISNGRPNLVATGHQTQSPRSPIHIYLRVHFIPIP